jgi:hypothetical protein
LRVEVARTAGWHKSQRYMKEKAAGRENGSGNTERTQDGGVRPPLQQRQIQERAPV